MTFEYKNILKKEIDLKTEVKKNRCRAVLAFNHFGI